MANKKFYFLDNKEWLFSQLLMKSPQQLAKECGCNSGSILYKIHKPGFFTPEELAQIKFERTPHKKENTKRTRAAATIRVSRGV